VANFKNQLITEQIFQVSFLVQIVSTNKLNQRYMTPAQFKFVRDKSQSAEFFLDITQGDGNNAYKQKRVNVVDIEEIDPTQGTAFKLKYYCKQSLFSNKKTIKAEEYESRHIVAIMDALENVRMLIDESDKNLTNFIEDL